MKEKNQLARIQSQAPRHEATVESSDLILPKKDTEEGRKDNRKGLSSGPACQVSVNPGTNLTQNLWSLPVHFILMLPTLNLSTLHPYVTQPLCLCTLLVHTLSDLGIYGCEQAVWPQQLL